MGNYITRNDMGGGPFKITDPGHGKIGDPKLMPMSVGRGGKTDSDQTHAGKEGLPSLIDTRPRRIDGMAQPPGKGRSFPSKGKGNNGGRPLTY